jgi:hypothetical protein
MIKHVISHSIFGLSLAMATASGFAQAITPTFTTFETFPIGPFHTFGTSGSAFYPSAAVTTFGSPAPAVSVASRLGLTVTQGGCLFLCSAVNAPRNDGAGTFFVNSGPMNGTPPTSGTVGPNWTVHFSYALDPALYSLKLLYDFDPAVGNFASTHGQWLLPVRLDSVFNQVDSIFQIGFGGVGNFGVVDPASVVLPRDPRFNPNSNGEYSFALVASSKATGLEVARSAILVTAVPEPEGYALAVLGLAGLCFTARRRGARNSNKQASLVRVRRSDFAGLKRSG